MKPIPYGKQHITEEDIDAVTQTLQADFLTQGPAIAAFENAFADYIGAKYAVAVSNGTAALHLCTLALGVSEKDNVITTPITFAASANCVKYCGGNVYFADIDPDTYLLDLHKVEELILSKPPGFFTGMIPVDFTGRAVDMEKCRTIAEKYNLWIIEDACHAPGGYFLDSKKNKQNCGNGNFANMAIFSFHPVKHIACGEGGMITTNDEKLYKKLILLRTHGITKEPQLLHENHGGWYYEMQELGYNYRLTDFQAALGLSQLKRADIGLHKRKEIAYNYESAFAGKPFLLGQSGYSEGHAYHLYIIEIEDRKDLYNYLRENNIYAQIHYIPVHLMPYYKQLEVTERHFPKSEKFYKHCISLPMYPTLTKEEQKFVIDIILNFFTIEH